MQRLSKPSVTDTKKSNVHPHLALFKVDHHTGPATAVQAAAQQIEPDQRVGLACAAACVAPR